MKMILGFFTIGLLASALFFPTFAQYWDPSGSNIYNHYYNYNGYVGIGTNAPVAPLSVTAPNDCQAIFGQGKTSGYMEIAVGEKSTSDQYSLNIGFNRSALYGCIQIAGAYVGTGLNFPQSGRVGIGTTSPSKALTVVTGVADPYRYQDGHIGIYRNNKIYLDISSSGTNTDTYLYYDSNTNLVKFVRSGAVVSSW